MERKPDRFFRFDLAPQLAAARADVAGFVGAEADDLVFVPNATTGINTVVKNLTLKPEDEILHTDHAYLAVKNAVDATIVKFNADVLSLDVELPIRSEDEYVRRVMQVI